MGMAASQARYLALTARKTNCEWEGQQINQARTALANQSANLFNRLLDLEVPNAPKTTDYTEIQYSFSDGENESVLDSWQQLSTADPNYNYIVNHYYYADIYTGSQKLLENPQVHIEDNDIVEKGFIDPSAVLKYGPSNRVTLNDGTEVNADEITTDKADNDEELKKQFNDFATAKDLAYDAGAIPAGEVYGYQDASGTWHFFLQEEIDSVEPVDPLSYYDVQYADGSTARYDEITTEQAQNDEELQKQFNDFATAKELAYDAGAIPDEEVYGYQDSDGTWHFFLKEELQDIDNQHPEVTFDPVNNSYTITTADGKESYTYNSIDEVEQDTRFQEALRSFEEAVGLAQEDGTLTTDNVYGYQDSDGTWHFFVPDDLENPVDYSSAPGMYVGNCKLSELTQFTEDQAAELAQILKDCPDSAMNQYLSFDSKGNLIYEGQGIYSFEMNGKTYYTTESDFYNSLNTPYDPEKPIEIQNKLAYYNASYIKTKIEETNHALLETDGNGRFTSVKFDDDSVVYSLNVETVTDDAAYQDAMNEYMYKKEQYEKTIADINAQTSIIQQEDRTLELRLKQLDTEQNALSTEMDAVKKVIQDNVENTFKTFSD